MNSIEIESWFNENNKIKSNMLSTISGIENLIGNQLSSSFTINDEEQVKFHNIFFNSPFVSFNSKINMYESFLRIYEKKWFTKKEIKQLFDLLKKIKIFRFNFVHAMNPIPLELKQKSIADITVCWFFLSQKGNMASITYSKKQVESMNNDLKKLKKLLLDIELKILKNKKSLEKKIKSKKMNSN